MTVIVEQERAAGMSAGARVWHCDLCRCFHLRAGEVLLTLTPEEFNRLTHEVVECYCREMLRGGAKGMMQSPQALSPPGEDFQ